MTERKSWIDIARGLAVVAIVLMHITFAYVAATKDQTSSAAWAQAVNYAWPFHLTTLFVLSGLVNSQKIRAGFPYAWRAVISPAYLYIVWSLIYLGLTMIGLNVWVSKPDNCIDALKGILFPKGILWFVLALAVWSAFLALIRKVKPWIALSVTAAISIGSWWLPGTVGIDQYIHVVMYGFFFAVGVYGREWVITTAQGRPIRVLVSGVAIYGLARWAVTIPAIWEHGLGKIAHASLSLAWSMGACLAVLGFAALAAKFWPTLNPLMRFGQRSASIYLLHLPLIALLALTPMWAWFTTLPIVGVSAPIVATLAICGVASLVEKWAPTRFLFQSPHRSQRLGAFEGAVPSDPAVDSVHGK